MINCLMKNTGIFSNLYQLHQPAPQSNTWFWRDILWRKKYQVWTGRMLMLVNYQTGCLWIWWIMMHTQEVLQRTHSISNILTHLDWASTWIRKCLAHRSSSILLMINTQMGIEICSQQQRDYISIIVWILWGLTVNLVIAFLDSTHLPLFVMESLQNGNEMEFC